jgi:hypothetical protein
MRQKQDFVSFRPRVESLADDDDGSWVSQFVHETTEHGPDCIGGDGDDDDLGAVERGSGFRVAEGGDPSRQWNAEPRVRVAAVESLDDGRVPLRPPEAQLMTSGTERSKQSGAHVARAEDCHTCHIRLSWDAVSASASGHERLESSPGNRGAKPQFMSK